VSASRPIAGDPLSEAVVGVHVYDVESFISDELPRIVDALRSVDIDSLRGRCDLATFRKHNLYPRLAETTKADEEHLWQTLKGEYKGMLGFYSDAAARHLSVIVSIY